MISIVLYGRNDSYGYNLHKRAALSFNCMAELLTDDDDEILFVDYNTPDDFPTFPEAIQDTLTPLARKRLRILRVRPGIHERFRSKTRLVALEPISRNVAVRRSNPANRWILSTNTDMIFVPQTGQWSLSDISRDLPYGFYHAPRLEIPETLWEGLDRQNSHGAIEMIKDWGTTLHLNEIVLGAKTILYDGPGDFQLMERSDLFRYDGFHEEMLLGWHVDSNIAKRLYLVHGTVGDLGELVYGYHCDHTRQITPMHSHSRTQNDWRRFIDNVEEPGVPEQSDIWGCNGEDIEEVRLSGGFSSGYVAALRSAIGAPLEKPPIVKYSSESYGFVDYDPKHILSFLLDIFITANVQTMVIGWMGIRRETLEMFAQVWAKQGFVQPILVDETLARGSNLNDIPNVIAVSQVDLFARAGAFVIDFGAPKIGAQLTSTQKNMLTYLFLETVEAERASMASGKAPRRVVSLNAIHTPYESLVAANVAAGLTPFATRMRHGFVLPPIVGPQDWTALLRPTDAAEREGTVIRARPDATGMICFGPYQHLSKGVYRIEFKLSGQLPAYAPSHAPAGVIELIGSEYNFGYVPIRFADVAAGKVSFELEADKMLLGQSASLLQTRVVASRAIGLTVLSLTCERVESFSFSDVRSLGGGSDWLSAFRLGPVGRWRKDLSVTVAGGAKDLLPDAARFLIAAAGARKSDKRDVAYAARNLLSTARMLLAGPRSSVATGPQALLMAGRYEMLIGLETAAPADQPWLFFGVHSKGRVRCADFITGQDARAGEIRREFEVHVDESPDGEIPVEFFIHALGHRGRIKYLRIRRLGDSVQDSPWMDYPAADVDWLLGASVVGVSPQGSTKMRRLFGRWTASGALSVGSGESGPIANSGSRALKPGHYEAVIQFKGKGDRPFLRAEVVSDDAVRATGEIGGNGAQGNSRVAFELHPNETDASVPVEIRLQALGGAGGVVQSIKVSRIGDASPKSS
ncbi:hypothetical protein [Tardiphaga sp. 839_C3_N1_4]|jgi:hypothetical protein|uniref:hypothetical protein n=1 Tax=Tardiphaga sp. 839_C3_N1_4 TaxID=3240761 RepID=UPI003F2330B2